MNIKIKLLNPRCNPLVQTEGNVGADVQSMIQTIVNPGRAERIPLGFAIEIPEGYVGDCRPRSGLSLKCRVTLLGTVDPSYRGEVCAIVHSFGPMPWVINLGDRIAQLVILPAPRVTFETCTELSETSRGAKGFGSSGVQSLKTVYVPAPVDANGSPVRLGGNGG